MILVVNGCSHAAGSEIDSLQVEPRGYSPDKAFGAHLAAEIGCSESVNIAMPGGSNERILRTTIEYLDGAERAGRTRDLLVFVMWTGPARFEFYDESIADWVNVCPGIERTKWFDGLSWAVQRYFKYHMLVRTSRMETSTRRWVELVLLESYLRQRGVRYFFCNAYDPLDESEPHASFRRQMDPTRYYRPFDGDGTFWHSLKGAGFDVQPPLFSGVFKGFQGHYGEEGQRYWATTMAATLRERSIV